MMLAIIAFGDLFWLIGQCLLILVIWSVVLWMIANVINWIVDELW